MQAENLLPIDIQTNKLLDWLISRRHCNKDWQSKALVVREKINSAIQDMPEVEEITNLLSGTYIHYFHCQRIVEILRDTEASTKNLFGRYSSQRMKDWLEILKLYEKDNIYLAEAAQMLIRTVNYEVPALKRQIQKCQQVQEVSIKKEADYEKHAQDLKDRYQQECKQLGIKGESMKLELMSLLDELPGLFSEVVVKLRGVEPAVELYRLFLGFTLLDRSEVEKSNVLPMIRYLLSHGNTTTYQWRHGEAPEVIEETLPLRLADLDNGNSEDQIDFGDLDSIPASDASPASPNGDFVHIDFGKDEEPVVVLGEDAISWDISVQADGAAGDTYDIVQETPEVPGGPKVAKGPDALSLLHNPETRTLFLNELRELECFLAQRLIEMQLEGDALSASVLQQAPSEVQMQTRESVHELLDAVRSTLSVMTDVRMQHLYQLHSSPKYMDRLVETLQQKLYQADKMLQSREAVVARRNEAFEEQLHLEPKLDLVLLKTRQLQKQIQEEISKRYKDRPVNIMGGINVM